MVATNGLKESKFSHYTHNAGENKGEPATALSTSELSRTLNVEQRGRGLTTRFGSIVVNVDGDGFPDPFDAGTPTQSGFGFSNSDGTSTEILGSDTFIYKDAANPTVLTSGLSPGLRFQYAQIAQVLYITNGVDDVKFYQPDRDDTVTYTAGYGTPAAFTAADTGAGLLPAGTYEYYVTLYDQTTRTESNRQLLAVSVVTGANRQNTLSSLPIDAEARSTHWRIYRKDPTGYYHYDLVQVAYNGASPTYIDNFAATGNTSVAPTDNFRPDVAKSLCQHGKTMIYMNGSTVSWSKPYRYQNVPTANREQLEDDASNLVVGVSFKKVVVVFKERSIYVLRGDFTTGAIDVDRISKTVGTLSPDSVKETPDGLFFFGSDGKPRLLTETDFNQEDLRDETDISFKYRERFDLIDPDDYENVFGIVLNFKRWAQYRLFVPIDIEANYTNYCFVYDYGLARRNGGDSAWFSFRYNINMKCAFLVRDGARQSIYVGDDYSLIWKLDISDSFFDGDEFIRYEDEEDLTIGVNTIDVAGATMGVNQFLGMQIILYDAFTFNEIFRSRIVSNTADQFTLEDAMPTLTTGNPYITVGGYLTYFGTADFTHDRAGRMRGFKASLLLQQDTGHHDIYFFVNYDFNDTFNYTWDYINNPDNASLTPRSDIYLISLGDAISLYDEALYDESGYGNITQDVVEFPLNNKYLFHHASWGIITRDPSRPFIYLGGSLFYAYKGLTQSKRS